MTSNTYSNSSFNGFGGGMGGFGGKMGNGMKPNDTSDNDTAASTDGKLGGNIQTPNQQQPNSSKFNTVNFT